MIMDAYTDTWRIVAAKLNDMLEAARDRLEANDQSYGESQFLRGRVSACREILELAKPKLVSHNPTPQELRPRDRSGV